MVRGRFAFAGWTGVTLDAMAPQAVVAASDGLHVVKLAEPSMWQRFLSAVGALASPLAKQDGTNRGAMVAFFPDLATARNLALDGGEAVQDLHVTLAFLGPDATVLDREKVEAALAAVTSGLAPIEASISGLGRFTPEIPGGDSDGWPLYASVDSPALPALRQRLIAALQAHGVEPVLNHGFSPHVTLAMVGPEDEEAAGEILAGGIESMPLRFDRVTLAWGAERKDYPLTGMVKVRAHAGPVVKANEELRYTFGPWYPATPAERAGNPLPSDLDAHGEYATADDLQKAVWSYVANADRSMRLQHSPDTEIGQWVELVSWPWEHTAELSLPTGETVTKSFAAGTVWMGARWNDVGWPLVKAGRIRGYSLGGSARRVNVEVGP